MADRQCDNDSHLHPELSRILAVEGGVSWMYVCKSNGISERRLRLAIESGARTWEEAHEFCGCKPSCGRCEVEITSTIQHQINLNKNAKSQTLYDGPELAGAT